MVTDRGAGVHPPFEGFVVVTTVKPDGRLIHYYEWPAEPPDPEAPGPGGDRAADAAPATTDPADV
jgi:hypothetical protein